GGRQGGRQVAVLAELGLHPVGLLEELVFLDLLAVDLGHHRRQLLRGDRFRSAGGLRRRSRGSGRGAGSAGARFGCSCAWGGGGGGGLRLRLLPFGSVRAAAAGQEEGRGQSQGERQELGTGRRAVSRHGMGSLRGAEIRRSPPGMENPGWASDLPPPLPGLNTDGGGFIRPRRPELPSVHRGLRTGGRGRPVRLYLRAGGGGQVLPW